MKKSNLLLIKFYLLSIFFLFISCHNNFTFEKHDLNNVLNETSGLELINSKLVTHNDSGDKSRLFIGNMTDFKFEEVIIKNATNIDWEDICYDGEFLYIADTGNNFANRKNLKIYKTTSDFELIDSISISYASQKKYKKKYKNKYDAEAIISFKSNLILFSKNRANLNCNIYKIPKNKKEISLSPIDQIKFPSLITGADYNEDLELLCLVGYSSDQNLQYLYFVPKFDIPIDENQIFNIILPYNGTQFESVKIISNHQIILTSEDENNDGVPFLLKVNIKSGLFNTGGKFILE